VLDTREDMLPITPCALRLEDVSQANASGRRSAGACTANTKTNSLSRSGGPSSVGSPTGSGTRGQALYDTCDLSMRTPKEACVIPLVSTILLTCSTSWWCTLTISSGWFVNRDCDRTPARKQ